MSNATQVTCAEVMREPGEGESDPPHALMPTLSAIHSFTYWESKPATGTHPPSDSYILTGHTQAHIDTDTGCDRHSTCRRLVHRCGQRGAHAFTLTHILLQNPRPTCFHTDVLLVTQGTYSAWSHDGPRDMLYGRLMGRPHMCLSLQQSRSSHGVREKVSFDECISFNENIRNFAIKRSHIKAVLIFISKTKLTQGLWGHCHAFGLCFRLL